MSKNFMIYLIGISGSGKSTIANALAEELNKKERRPVQIIDGDTIREEFGGIFGYTYEERMKCNQAVRVVLKYLLNNGISVILSQVGAYEAMRSKVRECCGDSYVEVYVKCSYEECARRDVKGYYIKQKQGGMENLNGAGDTFEIPLHCSLEIDTEKETIEEAVQKILSYLKENEYDV